MLLNINQNYAFQFIFLFELDALIKTARAEDEVPPTITLINVYLKRWFMNSTDRKGGRKSRQAIKNGNATSNEETENSRVSEHDSDENSQCG